MKITESWLYLASEITDVEITIADDIEVSFFDDAPHIEKFILWEHTKLKYFSSFITEAIYNKHFLLSSESAELQVKSFLYAEENTVTSKILGELEANHAKEDIHIVSFAWPNGVIDLDGIVQIDQWIEKVEWYLKEENIFLWESGKIRWIPTLLVRSNDVSASHACNIEKISDDKLFYLRSRGIEKSDATSMMILSYIEKIFWGLREIDEALYERVTSEILEKIQK